jgi:hypothetical protein
MSSAALLHDERSAHVVDIQQHLPDILTLWFLFGRLKPIDCLH